MPSFVNGEVLLLPESGDDKAPKKFSESSTAWRCELATETTEEAWQAMTTLARLSWQLYTNTKHVTHREFCDASVLPPTLSEMEAVASEYEFRHRSLRPWICLEAEKSIASNLYDGLRQEISFSPKEIVNQPLGVTLKRYLEIANSEKLQPIHHDLLRFDCWHYFENFRQYAYEHEVAESAVAVFLANKDTDQLGRELTERSPHEYDENQVLINFFPTPLLIAQIWVAQLYEATNIFKTLPEQQETDMSLNLQGSNDLNKKARETLLEHDLLEPVFGESLPEHLEMTIRRLDRHNPTGTPVMAECYPRMKIHGDLPNQPVEALR